jgi:hypothetical protein
VYKLRLTGNNNGNNFRIVYFRLKMVGWPEHVAAGGIKELLKIVAKT